MNNSVPPIDVGYRQIPRLDTLSSEGILQFISTAKEYEVFSLKKGNEIEYYGFRHVVSESESPRGIARHCLILLKKYVIKATFLGAISCPPTQPEIKNLATILIKIRQFKQMLELLEGSETRYIPITSVQTEDPTQPTNIDF